ncbi:MAG: DNA polymerase I, partial [Deltaproteobacteria bacterium]|nr:DNA polymerase I [Deltaproteobacteria bacterium]
MKEEIYLVDGSAYIYRAYHAIAPLSNSRGVPTHAVLGFINIVKRLVREKSPKYLAVAFDSKGPVFRHRLYDKYKANRPPMPEDLSPQIPYIKKYVEAAGIPFLKKSGVEADDLIASATQMLQRSGYKIVIVSGDKDLLQLVGEDVVMWDPMKNKIMTPADVEEKYKVSIDQLLDTFSLMGDSADNIPGVMGIGPKTAEKLINSYGSLDGIYENLGSIKKSKMKDNIIAGRSMAYLSRDLIRLKTDVDVPSSSEDYKLGDEDDEQLAAMYGDLEFTSLLKGIDNASPVPADGFTVVRTADQLAEVVAVLAKSNILAVDTETTSLDARVAELVGISLSTDLQRAWYIPVGHVDENGKLCGEQLSGQLVCEALRPFLVSESVQKIGHNLKYDITVFRQQWSVDLGNNLFDTLIAAYLAEIGGRSLKLDDLCRDRGVRLISFDEAVKGDQRDGCFAYVDIDAAGIYSCE